MKAVLLRVGIDTTYNGGGIVAPLFEDGSFEYIPIPDIKQETNETKNYDSFKEYVPIDKFKNDISYNDAVIHNDPNFDEMSYGDPKNKRGELLKLKRGDYLIFWEGFYPFIKKYPSNKFKDIEKIQKGKRVMAVIGYFKLIENAKRGYMKEEVKVKFPMNAHVLRKDFDENTIFINGKHPESKKLPKAIPLSWECKNKLYRGADYLSRFGLNNKIFQSSWNVQPLEEPVVNDFITFINKGPDMKIIDEIFTD